jgi:hypothetical protein
MLLGARAGAPLGALFGTGATVCTATRRIVGSRNARASMGKAMGWTEGLQEVQPWGIASVGKAFGLTEAFLEGQPRKSGTLADRASIGSVLA